jgi:hypothetical protein
VKPGDNWGATVAERTRAMACDDLMPDAAARVHRAVSIDAPPAIVFDWLCQLRLAPYSYDLLDNLGRPSPRELVPGTNDLVAGQRFMTIFALASFERDRHITVQRPGVAVTYALLTAAGGPTRLVVRVLFKPGGPPLASMVLTRLLVIGDLVMMRRQLVRLKAMAERDARRAAKSQAAQDGG